MIVKRITWMVVTLALLTACGVSVVRGSGNIIRENREIGSFDRVLFSGSGELVVSVGAAESLTVVADERILPYIKAEVQNQTLLIAEEGLGDRLLINVSPIRYMLTVDNLSALAMSTAGKVSVEEFTGERLLLEAGGGGTIVIESLDIDEVIVRVGGGSTISLAGRAREQKVLIKENGVYEAGDFRSQTADVTLTERGSGTVWVEALLVVKHSGRGTLRYYGAPALETNDVGVGEINSLGVK